MVGSGNEYFKQDKYPEAIKHYTEALKRNPSDPKASLWQSTLPICSVLFCILVFVMWLELTNWPYCTQQVYSNRAACYTKLGALPEGLKDANKCIELDHKFVKGYSRKAAIQFFMKEYDKALETYQVCSLLCSDMILLVKG